MRVKTAVTLRHARPRSTLLLSHRAGLTGALASLDSDFLLPYATHLVRSTASTSSSNCLEWSTRCLISMTRRGSLNGCSDLFVGVFGEAGRHARSAVGNVMLPNQISVEIEGIVAVKA